MSQKLPPLLRPDAAEACVPVDTGVATEPSQAEAWAARLDAWLEQAFEPVWAPFVWPALIDWCAALKRELTPAAWAQARQVVARHDIALLALEDPWTALAASQAAEGERMVPAEMIDLALEHPGFDWLGQASPAGRAIQEAMATMPLARALREQHRLMARIAESMAAREKGASFLTLDAGALREAELVRSAAGIQRWLAQSAQPVARPAPAALPGFAGAVRMRRGLGPLLRATAEPSERYAFIAMPRTLARLPDRQVASLIAQAFGRLAPGGVLLVSALAEDLPEAAYFELFAGWAPLRRSEAEMRALLEIIPAEACLRRDLLPGTGGMHHALVTRGF